MKKIPLFLLLTCTNVFCLVAQPSIQWQKSLGGTNYEQAESVQQTYDGGYIVAGISTSINGDVTGNHGAGDFWVVKLGAAGVIEWENSFGGSGDDGAFSIEQTEDSGYIIAGSSTSSNGNVTGNHGMLDYWIVKLDKAGVLLWQKSLGGSIVEIAYDIHSTSNNGFIVTGYSNSNDGDVTLGHGLEDFWIVKLDSTGIITWQKAFGGSDEDRAFSIRQTTDGGYITCGFTRSTNGDVTNNHGDYDYWIVKLDSSGTLQWQKTLGGTMNDQARCISQTFEGGYIVTGFTASADGDVTLNHGSQDLWMIKLDSSGVIEWEKSLGGSGVDQAYYLRQKTNGHYIIAGSSYSLDGDVTGNHGGYDYWIVETDSAGTIVWEKSFGGSSVEEAYCIQPTDSSGYIIAGGTLSIDGDVTNNHGDFDYWIVKLDSTLTTAILQNNASDHDVVVYPNPVGNICHVSAPSFSDALLSVYDVTGRTLAQQIFNGMCILNMQPLHQGVYVIIIKDEKNGSMRKVIVKQ